MGHPRGEAGSALRRAAAVHRLGRCWVFDVARVQSQCSKRRWWIADRWSKPGAGSRLRGGLVPLGSRFSAKTTETRGGAGRVESGAVHLPRTILRTEISEMCASEVLVSEGGALRWRPVDGIQNHYWDSAILGIHGRFFRTLSARRRPFGLVAV